MKKIEIVDVRVCREKPSSWTADYFKSSCNKMDEQDRCTILLFGYLKKFGRFDWKQKMTKQEINKNSLAYWSCQFVY